MPSALDAYPLGQHYRDRSLRDERHVRASGNTPAEEQHTNTHIRAASGVTGKLNVNGDLQVKNLGKMRAGQTAYDTGIGWFFGYDGDTPVFSIGDSSPGAPKMTWDGSALSITGSVSADDGDIGGWSIGASQLTGGDTTLDSAGVITVGSGDDVVIMSSVDTTYRIWAGDANPADAPFSVTKAGDIVAESGEIGGWTLGPNQLAAVSGNLVLDSQFGALYSGATAFGTGTGWRFEYNSGTPRFRVGSVSDERVEWDGSALTVKGRIEFGTDDFLANDILHFGVGDSSEAIIEIEATSGTDTDTFSISAQYNGFLIDVRDSADEGTTIDLDSRSSGADIQGVITAENDGTIVRVGAGNNLGTGRIVMVGADVSAPGGSIQGGIRVQTSAGIFTLATY